MKYTITVTPNQARDATGGMDLSCSCGNYERETHVDIAVTQCRQHLKKVHNTKTITIISDQSEHAFRFVGSN